MWSLDVFVRSEKHDQRLRHQELQMLLFILLTLFTLVYNKMTHLNRRINRTKTSVWLQTPLLIT